ncbi:hypothetical protein AB0A71_36485 [Kitasatospora aureofaciens]|uniref:hypothetical protein n=1 Tax=Kitasatospora aureofaciens TaxID=1894 RepID=UPI0033E312A1
MIRRGRIHRIPAFAGLLALSLGSAVVTAAPAHASTAGINCTGWSYTTYVPGLTDTVRPTTVVVDGDLNVIDAHSPTGSCLPVNSTATAGERDVTAQLDLSCNQLIGESGVETIRWNNGTTSSFPFTAAVVRGLSTTVLTETGTVTSGEFTGGHVVETFTAANLDLLGCLTPGGVTSLNFATVLTITPA